MNLTNIQTFLCVAQHHSLSVAASTLFISQPTVSARLQQLESELGVTLVTRQKGVRAIELTPQGAAFVPIAARWVELNAETEQFSRQNYMTSLTVACPDSLNNYLFRPLYMRLARPENRLFLRVRTHQSPEIFGLLENREVQIGFAFHLSRSSSVRCTPLFAEKMVLLCSADCDLPEGPVAPERLDVRREIYLCWSQDLQIWHNSWFGASAQPYIQTDCAAAVGDFLCQPGHWALCPESVAHAFEAEKRPVVRRTLTAQPPDRVCYLLMQQKSENAVAEATCETFLTALRAHIASIPYLQVR